MSEEVLILRPDDEQAQLIARAIASHTAGNILTLLANDPKNSSELANELNLPLPTIQYHIKNLLEAGIIEIAFQKYSSKGKEVKYYRQKERLFIVTQRPASIRETLIRYGVISGIFIISGLILRAVIEPDPVSLGIGGSDLTNAKESFSMAAVPVGIATQDTSGLFLSPVITFLTGGFIVLILVIVVEFLWPIIRGFLHKNKDKNEIHPETEDAL